MQPHSFREETGGGMTGADLLERRDFVGALAAYEAEPGASARWNAAQIRLLLGDYSRWPRPDEVCSGAGFDGRFRPWEPPGPVWDGCAAEAVDLLADQGAGDAVLFARYLPAACQRVGEVRVVCPPPLRRLLACVAPGVRFLDAPTGGPCLPLMGLPGVFGPPDPAPYLKVPPGPVFGEMVAAFGAARRVGVCWTGNPAHPTNPARSLDPGWFRDWPGGLFSLQWGQHRDGFYNVLVGAADFLETAQVVREMDVVVTVSTSVSVIAGAMGKETHVLLDDLPFWAWGLGAASPWFGPHVRLHRQTRRGSWAEPVAAARAAVFSGENRLGSNNF